LGIAHSPTGPEGVCPPLARLDGPTRLRVKVIERTALVRFTGSGFLLDDATVKEVGDQLDHLIEEGRPTRLVLNFGRVRYLPSEVFDRLASLQKKVERAGGALHLCGLDPLLRDLMRAGHLDRVFDVCGDEAEALGLLLA
jgi:anti-anti-sigma factor